VTAPDDRAPAWSRRRILRVFAPVPLLALDGCGGGSHDDASSAEAPELTAPPSPNAPASAGPTAEPALLAQPETSRAPAVRDAVALTFHGDGSPGLAEELLSEAEKSGARLTVLAVGRWLANYPQMAERVLKGGHELGNHTENHLAVDRMSASRAFDEIEQCALRLEKLTGTRGRWFRQSQGQHASPTVREAANRAGYEPLLSYDLDSRDFLNPGSAAIVRNVLGAVQGGDVVSMHFGHPQTIEALPMILSGLKARGLRAVTASELFPLPPGATAPPSKHPSQPS
jgi:peptidoglycan/xylan/chitin deacetylase (PgdA/CDA1 family)